MAIAVALVIAALSLNACGFLELVGFGADPTAPAAEEAVGEALQEGDGPLTRLVERAMHDLLQATNAEMGDISVVSTEEVEWGDTGLGCPAPGEMYAQMITPGYFIVLQSGPNTFDYHTGIDPEGPLVQCTEDGLPAGHPPAPTDSIEGAILLEDDETLPRLIERAMADLVQAAGVATEEITVVRAEEVEWSDTSRGCPQPDVSYLQVITPGFLIVLQSGDNTYNFHATSDPEGPLVQCADNQPSEGDPPMDEEVVPLGNTQNEILTRLIERATNDLVQATGASADNITVVSAEEVEWNDTSLGCPEPDGMYAMMITPGFRIRLQSGAGTYHYHSATDPEGPLVQCASEADGEE